LKCEREGCNQEVHRSKFGRKDQPRIYCSDKCRKAVQELKRKALTLAEHPNCATCEKPLLSRKGGRKFCQPKCKWRFHATTPQTCIVCGKYWRTQKKKNPAQVCGGCRQTHRETKDGRKLVLKLQTDYLLTCIGCQEPIVLGQYYAKVDPHAGKYFHESCYLQAGKVYRPYGIPAEFKRPKEKITPMPESIWDLFEEIRARNLGCHL